MGEHPIRVQALNLHTPQAVRRLAINVSHRASRRKVSGILIVVLLLAHYARVDCSGCGAKSATLSQD